MRSDVGQPWVWLCRNISVSLSVILETVGATNVEYIALKKHDIVLDQLVQS